MKTTHSQDGVEALLKNIEYAKPNSLMSLTEGHTSQAFAFEAEDGKKFVLRIAESQVAFAADKYAADVFGQVLLVPPVIDIGTFDDNSFYCITEMVDGKTSNTISDAELAEALPAIWQSLAGIYTYDISTTHGYGPVDPATGNARFSTWHARLEEGIESGGVQSFRQHATNIGLDTELVDKFYDQFRSHLTFASETRRLLHGDPAFDNMLVDGEKVTAIIDWEQMEYGDWVSDCSRLDFWWPGRYGNIRSFADEYGLDADNLNERVALYWATNALWTIEFADKAKSKETSDWLIEYLPKRLVNAK